MKLIVCPLIFATLVTFNVPEVHAHHSMSYFDLEQQIAIEGVVTKVHWVNPHVYIFIDQTTDTGEAVSWGIEGLGPAAMRRLGWAKSTIRLGEALTVNGNPAKNPDNNSIYPSTIYQGGHKVFDGQKFFAIALSGGDTPQTTTTSLDGTWTTQLALPLVPFMVGTELQELTEAGAAAVAQWNELTMNPGANCTQIVSPLVMIIPDVKQITTGDGVIVIVGDYDGAQRTIHMDVATHDGASASSQGHSIGRWEGDSLVIDTTYFASHVLGNGWGLPSGSQKHLIERLSINDGGKSLTYHFELSDPEFLVSPLTGGTDWTYSPDLKFMVEECDLESARRFLEN